jgi:alkaline phosphatase
MGKVKKVVTFGVSVFIAWSILISPAIAKRNNSHVAKNVIFMVPDGQGLSNVTAARIFKNGPDGEPLHQETLENIGYQRTHSKNATVTDSAAAASAWAVGEKFENNEVSCHSGEPGECTGKIPTILELAASKGKATGLVATSQISHATPAAFGAHVTSRYCGAEIARQYIVDSKVDVILGGGLLDTRYSGKGCDAYAESYGAVSFVDHDDNPATFPIDDMVDSTSYITNLALSNGYTYVFNEAGMNSAVIAGSKKVLGMFQQAGVGHGKTPEMDFVDPTVDYPEGEPTLAEMTKAALAILEKDPDGLFLMVEGSQIDWADHANDIEYQIAESLAFDASVKVVLDWVNAHSARKNKTLIIIVADHDCGAFGVNGPGDALLEAGDIVTGGWTSGNHTAVDTIVYSQGPGSEKLNAAVDNTDLYYVMESVLH